MLLLADKYNRGEVRVATNFFTIGSSWKRSVLQEMQRLYYEREHNSNKAHWILNVAFCESDSSYFRQYSWWTRLNVRLGLA